MNKLYIRTLYGVEQIVFNVGNEGKVKTHYNPIFERYYAYGSSSNVKHNIKELFYILSKLQAPNTEFSKKATFKDGKISINENDKGEQGGVSMTIDVANPTCAVFGAWTSEVPNGAKYAKAALKSNITVSDMMPIHPLLQWLGNEEVGVFSGNGNSKIVLNGGKDKVARTPEEAAEFAKCSLEEAKNVFASLRPMNMYRDKRTASGIYHQDLSIELESFAKVKLSDITLDSNIQEYIDELKANHGFREIVIDGEKYLSPSKEDVLMAYNCLIDSILNWDFSSNNSLHGSVKEILRYSASLNAQKLNQCTSAAMYSEDGKMKARLALRDSKEVMSFNTANLEKWHVCDGSNGNDKVPTSIDADSVFKDFLIQVGEQYIL